MKTSKNNDVTCENGTSNVFADLGMHDADEKLAKAQLAILINHILKKKNLSQTQGAQLLGVDQSKISLLNRGRLSDFSIERLFKYLTLLHQDIEIVIKESTQENSQYGKLSVA